MSDLPIESDDEAMWRVLRNDPIVHRILNRGGTLRDCVVELSRDRFRLLDNLRKAEMLIPRKVRADDSTVYVWHCPDHLIPDPEPLSWFGRPFDENPIG